MIMGICAGYVVLILLIVCLVIIKVTVSLVKWGIICLLGIRLVRNVALRVRRVMWMVVLRVNWAII